MLIILLRVNFVAAPFLLAGMVREDPATADTGICHYNCQKDKYNKGLLARQNIPEFLASMLCLDIIINVKMDTSTMSTK